MLNFLVRSTLGSWGSLLLDFYLANSMWINGIILFLVLLNVLGRRTYEAILACLQAQLLEAGVELRKAKNTAMMQRYLDKGGIRWEELSTRGWFPFVSVPGKFLMVVKNPANLEKIYSAECLMNSLGTKEKGKS